MSEVLRFKAPGPWITRELRDCVQAGDYDALQADRDRLAAELAEANKTEGRLRDAIAAGVETKRRLEAELSAARADAERYRWLRSRMFSRAVPYAVGTALDQEIDAARATPSAGSARPCTCHPGDNPPVPCPRRYALSECRLAAAEAARRALDWLHQTDHEDSAGPALSGMQVVIDPTMPEGTAELRCGESRVPIVPSAGGPQS